jgi:hypothetical protein
VEEAHANLDKAAEELVWCSASAIEIARNNLARARAFFFEGDVYTAHATCAEVFAAVDGEAPFIAADAKTLEGQVAAANGDTASAKSSYLQAVFILSGLGADRGAAQLWFELATLLEDVGEFEAARDAYRSAAASTGLRARPGLQATKDLLVTKDALGTKDMLVTKDALGTKDALATKDMLVTKDLV